MDELGGSLDITSAALLLTVVTVSFTTGYNWWAPAPLRAINYRLHSGAAA